jgi:chromosome segregation ATPase
LTLKEKNANLWRKFGTLLNEIHYKEEQIHKNAEKVADLEVKIATLEKDNKGHSKEIKERLSTIADKRIRIFELKKKNQELEKFKFVLDYKITELQRVIKPKENEMQDLTAQIEEMDQELGKYRGDSSHLTLELKKLNLKLNGMEKEMRQTNKEKSIVNSSLQRFKTDLHDTHLHLDDVKELKAYTKRLYQRHVVNQYSGGQKQGAADVHKDYQRQRKFLEKSVDSLQSKLGKDMVVHKKENMRITKENIALIREINQLRREISVLRNSQKLKDQSKNAARAARLDSYAAAQQQRRAEMEEQMSRYQEQIRVLKAQIGTYKRMAMEDDGGSTQVRPPSSGLPPLQHAPAPPSRDGLGSRHGSRTSSRPMSRQLQPANG